MNRRKKEVLLLCLGLSGLYGCGSLSADHGSPVPETVIEDNIYSGTEKETRTDFETGTAEAETGTGAGTAAEAETGTGAGTAAEAEANQEENTGTAKKPWEELVYEDSLVLQYAENFTVDHYKGGYTLLTTVMDGKQFLIVPEDQKPPEVSEPNTVVLQRPVENLYLAASAVMDMFSGLDGLDAIAFSGQKEDGWYIEAAKKAMAEGDILYAGKYNKPDYELIVSKSCMLAIENTMISHSPEVIEKLEDFGIPVMTDYSSYETHPLGRTEWVRFYGALLGRELEAEQIFAEQAAVLEKIGTAEKTGQTVAFFFITSNGLVQVRQSSDYVPKMIELAGGKYIFQDLGDPQSKRSTMNMQVEEFYAGAKDADFLIYNSSIDGGISSVQELLGKCGPLEDFRAVKEGNVWCTTNDMYQQSLSAGYFIEDLHNLLQGEKDAMHYLYHVE